MKTKIKKFFLSFLVLGVLHTLSYADDDLDSGFQNAPETKKKEVSPDLEDTECFERGYKAGLAACEANMKGYICLLPAITNPSEKMYLANSTTGRTYHNPKYFIEATSVVGRTIPEALKEANPKHLALILAAGKEPTCKKVE